MGPDHGDQGVVCHPGALDVIEERGELRIDEGQLPIQSIARCVAEEWRARVEEKRGRCVRQVHPKEIAPAMGPNRLTCSLTDEDVGDHPVAAAIAGLKGQIVDDVKAAQKPTAPPPARRAGFARLKPCAPTGKSCSLKPKGRRSPYRPAALRRRK